VSRYTHGHEQAVLASHGTRTAATSAAYLLPHLSPGTTLLDVGCGPGSVTLDLAEAVAPGRVVGLEPVEDPLTTARAAAAERGDTSTEFVLGDVHDLPFEDGRFDVVHAHQVLQHLTAPVAALREMWRVAAPGGLLAARDADYAAMAWHPETSGLDRWREVYRAIAHGNGAEPDAGRHLRSWAREAGLPEPVVTASVWCYADAGATAWWGGSQADRVSGLTFVAQAAEHGLDEAGVREVAEAWRAWGGHPDAWFVVPHGELLVRKPV